VTTKKLRRSTRTKSKNRRRGMRRNEAPSKRAASSVGEHLDRLRQEPPVVEELEAVQRDDAERLPRERDRRLLFGHELEAVANGVRAGVDDLAAAQVRRGPRARRIVDPAQGGRKLAVELLGKGMADVVAAQAALDVRHGRAQRAAHHAPEHGRHGVAVDEHERRSPKTAALA
jgi:hypothetical protein